MMLKQGFMNEKPEYFGHKKNQNSSIADIEKPLLYLKTWQ